MRKIVNILLISICTIFASPIFAGSLTDDLSNCLADNLTGKERKSLAKWIFFAMAAHPEISSYSSATQEDVLSSDKYVGKLITRLLTVDCQDKVRLAHSSDPLALQRAFEFVGQVAMQELMTNENVTKAITNYGQFADTQMINETLSGK